MANSTVVVKSIRLKLLFLLLFLHITPASAWVVGVDESYPPHEFVENGKIKGFNIDLIKACAEVLNESVEFKPMPWSAVMESLDNGSIDIAFMADYGPRKEFYEFSNPVLNITLAIFVGNNVYGIASIEDLKNHTVAVERDDIAYEILSGKGARIIAVDSQDEAIGMLARGDVFAFFGNYHTGHYLIHKYGYMDIKVIGEKIEIGNRAIAVKKGNSELLGDINYALGVIKASGEYDEIYNKWFGEPVEVYPARQIFIISILALTGFIAFVLISLVLSKEIGKKTEGLKRSRETLKEYEEKYRSVTENIPVGVCIYQNGKIVMVNMAMEDISGYSRDELMKIDPFDLLHPDYVETTKKFVEIISEGYGDIPSLYVLRATKRDGKEIWLEVRPTQIYHQGEPAILASVVDITERKRLEDKIKESEESFRILAERSVAGIYLIQDDAFVYVNPRMAEIFGYDVEEMIGKRVLDFIHPDDREIVEENLRKRIEGEIDSVNYTLRIVRKDGGIKLVEVYGSRAIINQKPIVIGTLVDITELKKSEEKYRELWENANDILFIIDLDGNFVEVNRAARETFGYGEEEVEGLNIRDILDGKYLSSALEKIRTVHLTKKRIDPVELLCHTKDGKSIWIEVKARPFLEHGKVVAIQGVARDITERKRLENELRELMASLEEKVKQRTSQLEIMYNLTKELSFTTDFNEFSEIILKYVKMLVDYEVLGLVIAEKDINLIHFEVPENAEESWISALIDEIKEEFIRQNPKISENKDSVMILKTGKSFRKIIPKLLIPIKAKEVLGFMFIAPSEKLEEEQIKMLYSIADQIALAISRLKVIISAKEQLEAILQNMVEAVMLVNSEKEILIANRTAKEILKTLNLGTGDKLNLDVELIERNWKREISLDNKVFMVETNPINTEYADGWLVTMIDITEERELQKRILQQEKLATVGQLAGGIAHDFNNILASIIGASDIILEKSDNEEVRKFTELIIMQGERAAKLVRQILDFSRKAMITPKPVKVKLFMNELSKVLRATISENIELEIHVEDVMVHMDPIRLQQILLNIVLNSRDALPEGGKIKIEIKKVSYGEVRDLEKTKIQPRNYVRFLVEDNGVGMDEETLKKALDPSFTTKPVGKGSGLGLSQVYGIVRQHNGYFYLESKPNRGTKAYVFLPEYAKKFEEKSNEEIND